jgi:hypothetical protein
MLRFEVCGRGEELRSEAYHGGDAGRARLRRGPLLPLLLRGRPAVAGQALNPGLGVARGRSYGEGPRAPASKAAATP